MKGFDLGLFANTYKNTQTDPDATGGLRIPASVISELYTGITNGTVQLKPGYGEGAEPYVELRAAAWKSDGTLTPTGKTRPAISVRFDSPAEAAAREAAKAQRLAQEQGQGQQWGGAPAPAAAPAAWGAPAQQVAPAAWGAPAPAAPAAAPAPAFAAPSGGFDTSIPF